MLGSAVSSSTPRDFQPSSHRGVSATPWISWYAIDAPLAKGYAAVGMQRALESVIGLPSSSTSVLRMLVLLMPAEVRRSRMRPFRRLGETTPRKTRVRRALVGSGDTDRRPA